VHARVQGQRDHGADEFGIAVVEREFHGFRQQLGKGEVPEQQVRQQRHVADALDQGGAEAAQGAAMRGAHQRDRHAQGQGDHEAGGEELERGRKTLHQPVVVFAGPEQA
jgi:hypothetical protein